MGAGKAFLKQKSSIDQYFLTEADPISKRRAIKTRRVLTAALISLTLFLIGMIGLSTWEGTHTRSGPLASTTGTIPPIAPSPPTLNGNGASPPDSGQFYGYHPSHAGTRSGALNGSARSHSAAQVIRPGAGSGDPASALPLGYTLPVRLVNSILSTDTASPVIAEIPQDIISHGRLAIPAQTRAVGSVRYDEASQRLQLKFQTLVYPEGDQHPINAIGMMADGSAGLEGEYHSGEAHRQTGRFLGHFIGAMADGMKERAAGGPFGIPYEPGSLKNGILSGIALSAEDQAKSTTNALNSTKPTMTLQAGQMFLLFLEQEYIP